MAINTAPSLNNSSAIPGPSTPIVPSSKAPPVIPRNPSSTIPSSTRPNSTSYPNSVSGSINNGSVAQASGSSSILSLGTSLSAASTGLSYTKSVYDKNLNRRAAEVSLSSFAFLFAETIQYLQKKSGGIQDLEGR